VAAIASGGCASDLEPSQIRRMRFEPARMAELRGDHATALAIYEDAAVDGIAYAQYRVAGMYESRLGTGRDYRQAARCTPPPRSRVMPERSEA
jgi:TPR repeat protein